MIEAGKCYCQHCGNVFSQAYYQSATQRVGALLLRPKFGSTPQYVVRAHIPGGTVSEEEQLTLESVGGWEKNDGIPNAITVRNKDGKMVEMKRSCPECSGNAEVYSTAGKCPTLVIGIVGATGVGKSTWLRAISASGNYAVINRLGYPYELTFGTTGVSQGTNLATIEESEGSSNVLKIVEKATRRVVANVVLVDAAGELYEKFDQPGNRLHRILQPHGDYPGMDACLFFDAAEPREETLTAKEFEKISEKTLAVFNRLVADLPVWVPVGYVCTHADKLMAKRRKVSCVGDSSGKRQVPLLGKGTFSETTGYQPEQLLPRLIQEDLIAKASVLAIPAIGRCRGFVVQSCAQKKEPDLKGGKPVIHEDYTKTMNLFDPLLWVLHELKLFPLTY